MKADTSGLKRFIGTRAKITRLADEVEIFGWVQQEESAQLVLTFDGLPELTYGDPVTVQLMSKSASTTFDSNYQGTFKGKSHFTLPPLMRMDSPVAQSRRKPPLVAARLLKPTAVPNITVIDIAPKGVGFLCPESFEAGQSVSLEINSPVGVILIEGEVVYSRFDQEGQVFRTGMQFDRLARVDDARWNQLFAA